MAGWIALFCFSLGTWLLYSSIAQRARVTAARRSFEARGEVYGPAPMNASLSMMAEIAQPLVIGALVVLGAKFSLAYWLIGGGAHFSLADLLGVLYLLTAYASWFVINIRYREARSNRASRESASASSTSPQTQSATRRAA